MAFDVIFCTIFCLFLSLINTAISSFTVRNLHSDYYELHTAPTELYVPSTASRHLQSERNFVFFSPLNVKKSIPEPLIGDGVRQGSKKAPRVAFPQDDYECYRVNRQATLCFLSTTADNFSVIDITATFSEPTRFAFGIGNKSMPEETFHGFGAEVEAQSTLNHRFKIAKMMEDGDVRLEFFFKNLPGLTDDKRSLAFVDVSDVVGPAANIRPFVLFESIPNDFSMSKNEGIIFEFDERDKQSNVLILPFGGYMRLAVLESAGDTKKTVTKTINIFQEPHVLDNDILVGIGYRDDDDNSYIKGIFHNGRSMVSRIGDLSVPISDSIKIEMKINYDRRKLDVEFEIGKRHYEEKDYVYAANSPLYIVVVVKNKWLFTDDVEKNLCRTSGDCPKDIECETCDNCGLLFDKSFGKCQISRGVSAGIVVVIVLSVVVVVSAGIAAFCCFRFSNRFGKHRIPIKSKLTSYDTMI